MAEAKKILYVRLPSELYDNLEILACKNNQSLSNMVQETLSAYILRASTPLPEQARAAINTLADHQKEAIIELIQGILVNKNGGDVG